MNVLTFMQWDWDISIIEFFNKFSETAFGTKFFQFLSFIGTEYVYILLFGVLYWCIDKKFAREVAGAAFVGMLTNAGIKSFFNRLRPFQQSPNTITCRDTSILATDSKGNYISVDSPNGTYLQSTSSSFPSGHAQNASSFYNSFAKSLKKNWAWIVGNIICVLVMISRMVLGVHFLTDVLSGYLFGLGTIELVYFLRSKFKNEYHLYYIIIAVFGVLTFLSPIWSDHTRDLFTVYGSYVGLIIGFQFEEKHVGFLMTKSFWKNLIRLLLGLGIVIALKVLLKYTYSFWTIEGTYLANIFDFIRYGLMIFAGVGLYPLLIKKWSFLNDKVEAADTAK